MRQLILMRHGEAESAPPGGSDVERALTARGREEIEAAARVIAQERLGIDRVLVSSARRTLETAELLLRQLPVPQPAEEVPALYLAPPPALLQTLARCPAASHTVLIIGHNPGLSEFAERLTGGEQTISLRTAGVCLLGFTSDGWRDVAADVAASCRVLR